MTPAQLSRIRWAVRATLTLGVAASVTANVLHARDTPIAQAIAAWPPLALLLTVELISRVPVHRRALAGVRATATAAIAGIAAWVSYWHMAGVAARYGEATGAAHLIPLSVDGLVVVASVSLVELAGRIRTAAEPADAPEMLPAPIAEAPQVNPSAAEPPLPPDPVPPTAEAPSDDDPPAKVKKSAAASAPRRPFATTQRAAAAMQADGMSAAEIAEALAISDRQVRNALKPVAVGVAGSDFPTDPATQEGS